MDQYDIYAVLKGVIEGGGDVDLGVQFVPLAQENLFLSPFIAFWIVILGIAFSVKVNTS